jgi:hypothetical protein
MIIIVFMLFLVVIQILSIIIMEITLKKRSLK